MFWVEVWGDRVQFHDIDVCMAAIHTAGVGSEARACLDGEDPWELHSHNRWLSLRLTSGIHIRN